MTHIGELIEQVTVGRCVGIVISNNAKDVILENPRTYYYSGHASIDPEPRIPPGSSGSSVFVKTSGTARGSVGVLSYESDAFTLAIMFSNPFDRNIYSSEFSIEIFTGRKHFDSMDHLYNYMYYDGPPYPSESYRKVKLNAPYGELEVRNEEFQVKATISGQNKAIVKVTIDQKHHSANPGSPWKCPSVTNKGAVGGK